MTYPQLFIRVGKDRYALVSGEVPDEPVYRWDEEQKQIVPVENAQISSIVPRIASTASEKRASKVSP